MVPGARFQVLEPGTRKIDPSHRPVIEDNPTYVPAKGWAEMIRKVYEVDLLMAAEECGEYF
jgi:hypothetical protein